MISEDIKVEDLIKNSAELNKIYTFLYENNYILHKRENDYFLIDKNNSYRIDIGIEFGFGVTFNGCILSKNGLSLNYEISSFDEFIALHHIKDEVLSDDVANIFPYAKKHNLERKGIGTYLFELKNNIIYSIPVPINTYPKVYNAYCVIVFEKRPKLYISFYRGYNFYREHHLDKLNSKKELYKQMVSEMDTLDKKYLPKDSDIVFDITEDISKTKVFYLGKYYSLEEYEKLLNKR